jgi:vitamin K-dependent gamma-carboxylase
MPVDAASLAAFRILFGLIVVGGVARFLFEGWVEVLYVEPRVFLKYWGFSWVQVWPRWGMYAHYIALGLCAVAITIGYRTRIAAALFFLGFTYVELMDVTTMWS